MTFISLQAAIDRFGVSKRTLYNWMKGGRIEGRKTKYGAMVNAGDVDREVAAAKENPQRTHLGQRNCGLEISKNWSRNPPER